VPDQLGFVSIHVNWFRSCALITPRMPCPACG
jgi:hypothetical protein